MYKKQMTMQKVICLLALVASVLAFVYALGMMTDLYDTLSPASTHVSWLNKEIPKIEKELAKAADKNPNDETLPERTLALEALRDDRADYGFSILKDMQPFNRDLLMASIVLILLACLLFITNTASRRRYYIANYISTGLCVVANLAAAVWAAIQVEAFRVQYRGINHAALGKIMAEKVMRSNKSYVYEPSEMWFSLYYVAGIALLIASILLVLNVIWKIMLMKEEKFLLEQGKAVSK